MKNEITIGSKTAVELNGKLKCFEIVAFDSNPSEGRISFQSPLARALIGHRVGEKVKIKLPTNATLEAEVIEVWPKSEYEVLIF